eukprot:m.80249 g.80249  ORF g.80249 m.80249 type:complete len:291 (+) comp14198_c3_seq1:121-993(+)
MSQDTEATAVSLEATEGGEQQVQQQQAQQDESDSVNGGIAEQNDRESNKEGEEVAARGQDDRGATTAGCYQPDPRTDEEKQKQQDDDEDDEDLDNMVDALELSDEEFQERLVRSNELKEEGNRLFKEQEYDAALDHYSQAITHCCRSSRPEMAAFYNNRAACYFQMEDYEHCVEDCTQAITLKPPYVKALSRRALAHEKLEKLEEALQDHEEVLKHEQNNKTSREAVKRLPNEIKEQQEKMKTEMFAKLKDLGNMCLRPFGLSTDNFQMVQDPNTGSYSVNFVSSPQGKP